MSGAIDVPVADVPVSGVLELQGWAIDQASVDGPGVNHIRVNLDGATVTTATQGDDRPDITSAFGSTFAGAGWRATLDLPSLVTSGPHVLEVQITSAVSGDTLTLSRALQVTGDARFCVNTHVLWFSLAHAGRDLDRARAIGLTSVRFDVRWDQLEPAAKGGFDQRYMAQIQSVVDLAIARGLHPLLVLLGTPGWARGPTGSIVTPPTNAADLGDAAGYLAGRLAQRPGMAYEIWNEPNQVTFWDAPRNADFYAQMLSAAYTRIKQAAPAATVVGGALVFNDPGYLEGMYTAVGGGTFDALSLHPYTPSTALDPPSDPARSFRTALQQAQAVLAAHGEADKPIWITEQGWTVSTVDDAARANYLTEVVGLVRATPQIAMFCAYELNQDDDRMGGEYGLVRPDGSPTLSWLAYAAAIPQP
jgi:hypothetical protein